MLAALGLLFQPYAAAVEKNALAAVELFAEFGGAAIDDDTPLDDPALDLSPGTETRVRERLVNAFAQTQ